MGRTSISVTGSFTHTEKLFSKAANLNIRAALVQCGEKGVDALSKATPIDSGETAGSWTYRIDSTNTGYKVSWYNSNIVDGAPIAILLQYGHATRSGTFIEGIDYVNPAMKPILENISQDLWKEVTT